MIIKTPCPNCGTILDIIWETDASDSLSGYTEHVGHCPNENCDSDWKLYYNSNDLECSKIERYYFG